jgi:hypothetical protein
MYILHLWQSVQEITAFMIRKSTPSPQSPVSVVDRHRFDADADPDPTFHFDAEHNPD